MQDSGSVQPKPIGEFIVNRYNKFKDKVKQQGQEEDGVYTLSYHQLNEDRTIVRARVDDDPMTRDDIFMIGRGKGLMFDDAESIKESFTEEMINNRQCLTFNLVETIVMNGFQASSTLKETFDVKTFEKIPQDKK